MYYCTSVLIQIYRGGSQVAWNFDDNRSIYIQLIEQIQTLILTGVYPPGSRLPAVRELAAEAGVNPNTMQRALAELENTKLVYSVRTSGRFVTEDAGMLKELKKNFAMKEVNEFCRKMKELGYTNEEIISFIEKSGKDQ